MQSSNEFVITTQIVHTKKYITLSLLFGHNQEVVYPEMVWKMRAPYSVGTLVSLALLSNVQAGVITTPAECKGFIESFVKLSHVERVGYARILTSERVLANSQFKVHFCARGYSTEHLCLDLRKRAYLMSNSPISSFRISRSEIVNGDCTIGELVRGACYVPAT